MALTKISSNLVADDAIVTGKIADGGVATADLAANAVTTAKIAQNNVTAHHIADGSITTTQLGADAVTAAKLADDAVSEEHLDKTIISDMTQVTPVAGDFVLIGDTSDSNNLKKAPLSGVVALASGGVDGISSSADATAITIDSSENVGIGDTSPGAKLDVNSGTTNTMAHFHTTDDNGFIELKDDDTTGYIGVQNDYVYIGGAPSTNSKNIVINDGSGNVGIGQTSPSSPNGATDFLHIGNSSSTYTSLVLEDNNNTWEIFQNNQLSIRDGTSTRLLIDTSGNVGIGESSPAATLHVEHSSGTAYNGATELTESIIVSNKAGTDDSGVNNVASIGLHVADGATSQGFINYVRTGNNTGKFTFSARKGSTTYSEDFIITEQGTIGMGPGSGNLAGSIIINNDGEIGTPDNAYYNTVLGWEAADDLTSGDSNTIVGNQAGYKLTSGSNNTFIGRLAGETVTTGSQNTAVGYNAMGDGTCTGNYNVAMGYEALHNTTSGYENVCIGRDSGHDITSGFHNVSVGHESLTKMQTSSQCVAVGFQALEKAYSHSNVGIGYKAGENITSGTNNICLGKESGTSSSPSGSLTTNSNTICLGDDNIGNLFCVDTSISSSDSRDKADITNFTQGLSFITKMQPVTYKWDRRSWYLPKDEDGNVTDGDITKVTRDGSKKDNGTHVGFLAQDVETLEQEIGFASDENNRLFTNLTEDGKRYGIKYERLVTVLVNAVKELNTKLEAAEARIEKLES